MLLSHGSDVKDTTVVWKEPPVVWAAVVCAAIVLLAMYADGLERMVGQWSGKAEYSYGYLVPFISLFLIWQRADVLRRIPFRGSWAGLGIVAVGMLLLIVGKLSVLYSLIQYSFLVVLAGCVLAMVGWRAFRILSVPLFVLAFMIPLPDFIYGGLSEHLQLLSSRLGVQFLEAMGVSVFLHGNVIDLGTYKLQVEEACNGLRYLFPLVTFGFVTAYFFKAPLWKRAVIFLSTVPIAVLMNSVRIAVIGVMVDRWGLAMAEGFLHQFEGWVVFMICLALLLGEMWLLTRVGGDPRRLREVFGVAFPSPSPSNARVRYRPLPMPFIAAGILLVIVGTVSAMLPQRVEAAQARQSFSSFPMQLRGWSGYRSAMDRHYVQALKFDDYILADYTGSASKQVGLYAAYYASQRSKGVPHSPRACIPGDGWQILNLSQIAVDGARIDGHPLRVNRVEIAKGDVKELVYYWFQERGRDLPSEFLVKWYLFWDALTRNRSDGALVRLTTVIRPGQDFKDGDRVLADFSRVLTPKLDTYIPD